MRPFGELRDVPDDTVAEPRADRQKQVAFAHGAVAVNRSVHAEHAERQTVVARESRQCGHRSGHGNVGLFGELEEFRRGVRHHDAAAGEDDRAFCPFDRFGHITDFIGDHLRRIRVVAGQKRFRVEIGIALADLNIFGHIDQHRAGPAGRGDQNRLVHDPCHVFGVGDQIVMFCNTAADLGHRGFLEPVGPDHAGSDLAGNDEQRNRVEFRVVDAGDQIRRAGTAGRHADAQFAGTAGVPLRREPPGLLVAGKNDAEPVAEPAHRLVERNRCAPRIREDGIDSVMD